MRPSAYGKKILSINVKRFDRDNHGHIGIQANANVILNPSVRGGILQTIYSGGLFGIDPDSGWKYLAEIAAEELDALKAELESIGFTRAAIDVAIARMEKAA